MRDLVEDHMIPPLHPNCRCELIVMDTRAELMYSLNRAVFMNQLEASIDRRERNKRGGVYLLDHDFFITGIKPETLSRLTDEYGYILQDLSKPWGYVAPPKGHDIIAEAKELWAATVAAQEYRGEHKWDSIPSFLDWLTLGVPSGIWNSEVERWNTFIENPGILSFLDFATMGTTGMVVGAIEPEDPGSLQNLLDTIGSILLFYSIYKAAFGSYGQPSGLLDDTILPGSAGSLEIIDGKIGGKVPVDEYNSIRQSSIKNPSADSMTLGKYTNDSSSYISRAGNKSSYFDMGNEWSTVQSKYNLTDTEMFEFFNKPTLSDAISSGKTIRFSHNPLFDDGFLGAEWNYIKSATGLTDANLIFEGGFWIVK